MGKCCGEVRTAVRAVIVEKDRLLVVEGRDRCTGETFLVLPGGGQQPGETLAEAVARECLEEVGAAVEVERLLWVRDYIGANHEFADTTDGEAHQTELFFACRLKAGSRPSGGAAPDTYQIGQSWVPLAELDARAFFPRALVPLLGPRVAGAATYLGDVN